MSWSSAKKKVAQILDDAQVFNKPVITPKVIDWGRLVCIDYETYYATDYTLSKSSTSEYVRDLRFKAQMLGIKVGHGKTKIVPPARIRSELAKINWATHSVLAHNAQFDAFILSHHYGVHPVYIYDTLSMARGLHSNEIGAGLDEVSIFYGGHGKLEGLEATKGVLNWDKALFAATSVYCANDVDEMYRIFKEMLPKMPADEMDLIDLTCRMFTSPVLKIDIPRVEKELVRELAERDAYMLAAVDPAEYADAKLLKTKAEKALEGTERELMIIRKVIGSNERFADLIREEGIEPPTKISPAWMKLKPDEREEQLDKKHIFAFSKDDEKFLAMPNLMDDWGLDMNDKDDLALAVAKQERLQALVDVRIAVKSTTNITRAARFLEAGRDNMALPVGYAYYRAHTGRWGGQNKMNMQNLKRGGELRLSILAPKGHQLAVVESGQIECRVNGWLWGQNDLMESFRTADKWDKKTMGVATGENRDAYCKFGDTVYGREITTLDSMERFVGKVCVLGLGFQMGAPKLQITFAKGALGGPPVYFELDQCKAIVNGYRLKNYKIKAGWEICKGIIEDMAAGIEGSWGPINWEANTIWLPNGMALKYPDLRKSVGEKGWDEWSYQSGAMRKKIYGGLLCLGAKTQVLTDNGWKSIISVRLDDKLWDGASWVSHSGLVHQGIKETISFGGVDMTPDHEVLVNNYWYAAEETTHHEATSSFARHYWAPNRHVDSSWSGWHRWQEDALEGSLRLRPYATYRGLRLPEGQHEELRMLDGSLYIRVKNDARYVEAPRVRSVAGHARPLQPAKPPGVGALRRARNYSVSTVERVQGVLGRYASRVRAWVGVGPRGQLTGLQPGELSLGNEQDQLSQQTLRADYSDAKWPAAAMAGCRGVWDREDDVALPAQTPVASGQDVRRAERQQQDVFDLVNAGPLRRFTVRGDDGKPFIVHNCENIVQALARIIVAWQMLQIGRRDRVVMTTHDEVVTCIKTARAPKAFADMSRWMSTAPAWCSDIPLNCEGGWDINYSK